MNLFNQAPGKDGLETNPISLDLVCYTERQVLPSWKPCRHFLRLRLIPSLEGDRVQIGSSQERDHQPDR
jgi:hypothetical protein